MTRMLTSSIIFLLVACGSASTLTDDNNIHQTPASVEQISDIYLHNLAEYKNFQQAGLNLKLLSTKQDELGMTHLRYQQQFQSVPLLDAEIITHIRDQAVYRLDGTFAAFKPISAKPVIDAERAVAISLQTKKLLQPYSSQSSLVIVANGGTYDQLAWLVTINKGLQRYIFLVDALSAKIIREIPGIQTSL